MNMPLDNLSWLAVDLDTREGWYICQTDYSIHYKLKIFPYSENHTLKYDIQANEG